MTDEMSIYARAPINKTASVVTSGGSPFDSEATPEQLRESIALLVVRRDELKKILGITNYRQKKNFMSRYNKHGRRALTDEGHEFIGMGQNIQVLMDRLRELQ